MKLQLKKVDIYLIYVSYDWPYGGWKGTTKGRMWSAVQCVLTINELQGCFVISLSIDLISFCLNRCFSAFFLAPVFFFGISAFTRNRSFVLDDTGITK